MTLLEAKKGYLYQIVAIGGSGLTQNNHLHIYSKCKNNTENACANNTSACASENNIGAGENNASASKGGGFDLSRRLLDMGFTPDTQILVQALAPFGGTFLVKIRSVAVALREDAASLIHIIPVANVASGQAGKERAKND